MAIGVLLTIMPPPSSPLEVTGAWQEVESFFATGLPADYKQFIVKYGTGRIGGFIWVLNPFSKNPNLSLQVQSIRQLDALKELAGQFGEHAPYPLFPMPGGLLPFALTDNGDVLHWLTSGIPEQWSVVVNEGRGPTYERFSFDMTTFLARIVTRAVRCSIFPPDFPGNEIHFDPNPDGV